MFNMWPYADVHVLNLDWLIKVAKDFLDQYTHIQEIITNGETAISELSLEKLAELNAKAEELEQLLQTWYDNHSSDIANQLASSLATLSTSLNDAILSFNTNADQKAADTLATIPADYTSLYNRVVALESFLTDSLYGYSNNNLTWIDGYIEANGNENTTSTSFKHCTEKLDISSKRVLSIHCPISYNVAFISLYNNNVFVENIDVPAGGDYYTIPGDANQVVINIYFGAPTAVSSMETTLITLQRDPFIDSIEIKPVIVEKNRNVNLLDIVPLEMGSFSAITGEKTNSTTLCRNSSKIKLPSGTKINLLPLKSGAVNFHIFEYDENGSFAKYSDITSIPLDGTNYFTTTFPFINFEFYVGADHLSIAKEYFRVIAHMAVSKLAGKKISVLGDSLSTFYGVTDNNTAYYPAGNVEGAGLTWWGLLSADIETIIDTINAYGGSTIALTPANPMCADARLSALGTPDIIVLQGGTNDIYSNIPSGEWQGTDINNLDLSKFIPALTKIIIYLQNNYSADIVVIGPSLIGGVTPSFRQNCTVENIDRITENMRDVCRKLGAKFIDTRNLAMNLGNIGAYTIDNMHWNYNLMEIVANAITNKLYE